MSKYKVGDKVVIRKDLKDSVYYGSWFWNIEKEYMKEKDYVIIEVVDNEGHYVVENSRWSITDEMIAGLYKDVEKVKITKKQRIEKLESDYKLLHAEHAKLLGTVIELTEKVNELTNPTPVKTVEKPVVELTPNQKRKQIIDEAKEFVKKTESVKFELAYDIDLVNRVISVAPSKGYLSTKGTTTVKCLPKEVFNVHIGKAIALAKRYHKTEKIDYFANAIQPTEKVEGMKVEIANSIRELVATGLEVVSGCSCQIGSPIAQKSRIYDDSNAKY